MEEEVYVGVWEGHSRPAALRAEEPGSASLQTEPALFSGGQTPSGHDCALLHFQSQEFQREKCLLVSQTARNNSETRSRHLWNRGGWWRLHRVCWHYWTLKGCQCSTALSGLKLGCVWLPKLTSTCTWQHWHTCCISFSFSLIISVKTKQRKPRTRLMQRG